MGPKERPGTWILWRHPPYLVAPLALADPETLMAKFLSWLCRPHPITSCLLQEPPPLLTPTHPHTLGMCLITEAERLLGLCLHSSSLASQSSTLNLGTPWSCSTLEPFPDDKSDQGRVSNLILRTRTLETSQQRK